jgi:hypothetical protein
MIQLVGGGAVGLKSRRQDTLLADALFGKVRDVLLGL